ncbi:MAG: hypothetical protein ABIE75_01435 [Candidatus Omnitrophota bacterium]
MGKLDPKSWFKFKPKFFKAKLDLKSKVRPKFFWGCLIFILLSTNTFFYLLKTEEESLRIFTQRLLTTTQKELIDTIWAKVKVEKSLSSEKNRSKALSMELDQEKRQMQHTLNKLEKEIAARHKIENQLVLVMNEKKILEEKLEGFVTGSKTVELEKIVVRPMTGIVGKVLKVNDEHKFIVTNLGRENNLEIGDVLLAHRDNEFIGRTKVEKVEEGICAAAILSDWQDAEFKENDSVRLWR